MRYFIPVLFLLAACDNAPKTTGFDPPEGYTPREGVLIYQRHCEMCHGPDGKMGAGGAKDLTVSTLDSAGIVNLLKHGKNGMPRQMQNLESEEELDNIIDHVKSLRK